MGKLMNLAQLRLAFQTIYGINPMHNRMYLDPHLTPELAGTAINYNQRGKRLIIKPDMDSYSVADKLFELTAKTNFGFSSVGNQLSYFNGANPEVSLQVNTSQPLSISIKNWEADKMEWQQHAAKPLTYILHQLAPNTNYKLAVAGKRIKTLKSGVNGELAVKYSPGEVEEVIVISAKE